MPDYSADQPISRIPITIEDLSKKELTKEQERARKEAEKYAKPPVGAYFICYFDYTEELKGGPFDTEEEAVSGAKNAVLEDGNNDEEVFLILKIAKKIKLFKEFREENLE